MATSSGLQENVEQCKNKMSTYQGGFTMGVVLGQECKGVFRGAVEFMGVNWIDPMRGKEGRKGTMLTIEEFVVPPCDMRYV